MTNDDKTQIASMVDQTRTTAKLCHELGKTVTDEEWLSVLIESVDHPVVRDVPMPGFPDELLQSGMVGSAGSNSLREMFLFWQQIKKYYRAYGETPLERSNVLDFGCGWGRLIRFLIKDVPPENILGVDVASDFVDICQNLMQGVRFEVIDPLPSNSLAPNHFHLICAYSVFSHLSEKVHHAWISEFYRILKPGGIVIVTTQKRSFIDFCESLRQEKHFSSLWHEALSRSFVNSHQARQDYDAGKYIYSATGGGKSSMPPEYYGEAIVSPGYVREHWKDRFALVDFIDDANLCLQAIIVAKQK